MLGPSPRGDAETPGCPVPPTSRPSLATPPYPPPPPPAQSPADPGNPKSNAADDASSSPEPFLFVCPPRNGIPLPPWLPSDIAPGRYLACICGDRDCCGWAGIDNHGVVGGCEWVSPDIRRKDTDFDFIAEICRGGVEPSATSAHAFYLSPQTSGHECPPDRSTPTYDRDFPLLSPAPRNYAETPGCPVPFTPPASASPPPPPPAQPPADPSNPKFDATHDTGNGPLPPWLPDDIAPGRYLACLCGAEDCCGYRAIWWGGVTGSCLGANPPPP